MERALRIVVELGVESISSYVTLAGWVRATILMHHILISSFTIMSPTRREHATSMSNIR